MSIGKSIVSFTLALAAVAVLCFPAWALEPPWRPKMPDHVDHLDKKNGDGVVLSTVDTETYADGTKLVKTTKYKNGFALKDEITEYFDKDGNVIFTSRITYMGDGSVITETWDYVKMGCVKEEIKKDGTKIKTTIEYWENGPTIKKVTEETSKAGKPIKTLITENDQEGHQTTAIQIENNKVTTGKYDKDGKPTQVTIVDIEPGKKMHKTVLDIDENGKWTSWEDDLPWIPFSVKNMPKWVGVFGPESGVLDAKKPLWWFAGGAKDATDATEIAFPGTPETLIRSVDATTFTGIMSVRPLVQLPQMPVPNTFRQPVIMNNDFSNGVTLPTMPRDRH